MKLTGKCKQEFIKYLNNRKPCFIGTGYVEESLNIHSFLFNQLPESMQYGVYVDFFDSVEFYIGRDYYDNYWMQVENNNFFNTEEHNYLYFPQLSSREQAILKANEIYNK